MNHPSAWLAENWVALSVLAGFVGLMVLSAWRANRERGKRPGPVVIAISFYATFLSTNTFLGQSGFGYKVGVAWLLAGLVFLACAFVAWFVVAKPLIRDAREVLGSALELDRVTVPAYLRKKYSSPAIGYISAWVVFFASVLYMLAVFKGIGHIFARILSVSYEVAVVTVFVLVVAYTSWGMIRAILHTDSVQGTLMVVGALALFIATCMHADWSRLADSPDVDGRGVALEGALLQWSALMSPLLILGLSFSTGIKMVVAPRLVVRFLLFRHATARQIQRAKWVAVGLMALTIPMLFVLGVLAHGIIPQEQSAFFFQNTDEVVPYLVERLFGSFWGAVLLGSFLCAALSSIDSVLHVAGSALVVDLWSEWRKGKSDRVIDRAQRVVMAPVALVSAALALDPPADVVPLTALSGALFGGCFFPALVVSLWWKTPGRRSALASIACGGTAVAAWSLGLRDAAGLPSVHPIFAGLAASLLAYTAVAFWERPHTVDQSLMRTRETEQ